jgi:hypothetical protein
MKIIPVWVWLVLAIVLTTGGFATGWHAKGVSVKAGQVTLANKTITTITDGVNKQAAAQNAQLTAEQGKSLALDIEKNRIHAAGVSIQLEIADAQFNPPALDAGNHPVVCPDVTGSAEFVRLYNAAARGSPAAAASTRAR